MLQNHWADMHCLSVQLRHTHHQVAHLPRLPWRLLLHHLPPNRLLLSQAMDLEQRKPQLPTTDNVNLLSQRLI